MAAYAALVSIMNIIDEIQKHPRPPISLDEQQLESLTKNVTFLQEFLEGYNSAADEDEADPLETRIADASYAAEDVIESHIVDRLEEMRHGAGSHLQDEKIRSSGDRLYEGVHIVLEEMEAIKKQAKIQAQVQKVSSTPAASATALSTGTGSNKMVGFDKIFLEILGKLTGVEVDRQIIPIAGMGGCGKTTLARNVYASSYIEKHFDICAWTTISQECDATNVICELLGEKNSGSSSLHTLGDRLRKDKLFGRRYLIIMDDMWSNEVWDEVQRFFPNNKNGSRIIITTRLSNLGSTIGSSDHNIEIPCLDEDSCWSLFCETVFGEDACPPESIEIGKKIVGSCKGLPLSIVVVGGLLAKSIRSQEYWEYIGENISSTVNLEDDEHWLKLLRMSYSQLPIHLKPCFLYMGVFREDLSIGVSSLVRLWIAEGFLKPVSGKSMEVVARDYLHDLIDRNLVLVDGLGSTGNIKKCKLHDLLRDLCIREAKRERFYFSVRGANHSPQRRLVLLKSYSLKENIWLINWEHKKSVRSLIYNGGQVEASADLRLLRVSNARFKGYAASYNSRLLDVVCCEHSELRCWIQFTWNLQSLFVENSRGLTAPVEIWNMSRLRYVHFPLGVYLPEPPMEDGIVLGNLQALKNVRNLKCGEMVVERIPNIKKLDVYYDSADMYCLGNIQRLHKLEVLTLRSSTGGTEFLQTLTFPHTLKKLSLAQCSLDDALLAKIGSLPLVEKLLLSYCSIRDGKWETVDGQFRSLKYLNLKYCKHLVYWSTESSHFPRLEKLHLSELADLKELPSEIGEIPTLKFIYLGMCNESLVRSVKEMVEEQEELLGEQLPLDVEVVFFSKAKATQLQSLVSANFRIRGLV